MNRSPKRRHRRTGPGEKGGRASKPTKRPARVRSAPAAAAAPPPATEPATTTQEHPALAAYRETFPPDRPPRWTGTQRPPTTYYLALFGDPEFWRDTLACYSAVGDVTEQALSAAAFREAWKEILTPFWCHYRAVPAVEFLPIYYRQGFSVMAGRWGVVPVYAWTKDPEIAAAVRTIRKTIKTSRQDPTREAALGVWLKLHGFSSAEIAAALGKPARGKRPADTLPGSEPPIDAWLRVNRARLRGARARLRAAMQSPASVDPLSDALTNVLRVGVFPGPANLEDLAATVARLHDLLGVRPLL